MSSKLETAQKYKKKRLPSKKMANADEGSTTDTIDENLDMLNGVMKRMARVECYLKLAKGLEELASLEDRKDICRYRVCLEQFYQSFEEEKSVYGRTIQRLNEIASNNLLSRDCSLDRLLRNAQLRNQALVSDEERRERNRIRQMLQAGYSVDFARTAAREQELIVFEKIEMLCSKYNLP